MAAIDIIHNPPHLDNFGRHGDIKADNILLFKPVQDPRGILVVSDMGLSSFNRDTSRSNIPNSKIPGTPGYRPPECDVKGGTISRAYDIWTLGCLFLEILTWLLGGLEFLREFEEGRNTAYITGAKNNIFFVLKSTVEGQYVAQVKKEVTQVRSHEPLMISRLLLC
jgi:serine/threonine protein kinase